MVREAAEALQINLVPLPGNSPDFMPVEALWHWLGEEITSHYCHPTAEDLSRRVAAFETASGSRIGSTLTKRNYASQGRRGLATTLWGIGIFAVLLNLIGGILAIIVAVGVGIFAFRGHRSTWRHLSETRGRF
jgi:hypothetical protein